MRNTGLEPAPHKEWCLKPPRLPIPPISHKAFAFRAEKAQPDSMLCFLALSHPFDRTLVINFLQVDALVRVRCPLAGKPNI